MINFLKTDIPFTSASNWMKWSSIGLNLITTHQMSQSVVTNTLLVSTKTSIMLEVVRQHQTSLCIILPQCNFNATYSYSTRNISNRQIVIFAIDLKSTLSCVNISEIFFRLYIYSPLSPQCKASLCSAKYA